MKTLVLHASSFDACWAHCYFWSAPDFVERLRARGFELLLSRAASPRANERAAAVVHLEAFSAGAGRETRRERLGRKLRARLRWPGIPPADRCAPVRAPPAGPPRAPRRARAPARAPRARGGDARSRQLQPRGATHFDRILTRNVADEAGADGLEPRRVLRLADAAEERCELAVRREAAPVRGGRLPPFLVASFADALAEAADGAAAGG